MAERFETLLKRCRRRRLKRRLKTAGTLAVLAALLAAGVLYTRESSSSASVSSAVVPPVLARKPVPVPPPPAVSASVPDASAPPVSDRVAPTSAAAGRLEKRDLIALKKEADAREKRSAVSPSSRPPAVAKKSAAPVVTPEKRAVPETPAPQGGPAVTMEPEPERRTSVKPLIEVKDVTDIRALVRQFEKYPRYATALKIARLYYEKGRYAKASLWAKKANLLDRDDEAAWILYAKSEYALGRKERAKRILTIFLDYKDSAKARTLLMGWSKR